MKIRIIKERTIQPICLTCPDDNPHFSAIITPETNPIPPQDGDLTVYMHEEAYQSMWRHAQRDHVNELGGALLGYYAFNEADNSKMLIVTDVVNQPLHYFRSATLLRFTHQFYDDLNGYLDQVNAEFPNIIRLGLYHTHPDYGVYLSQTDAKTFKGVFKAAHQIAMVVDPIRKEDGVFYWENGDLSERSGFFTYKSDNPLYKPHFAHSNNLAFAEHNFQITTVRKQGHTLLNPKNTTATTQHSSSIRINPSKKQQAIHPIRQNDKTGRIKIQFNPTSQLEKTCPLYDFRYNNRQINLPYFKSFNQRVLEYPYMLFLQKNIVPQVQAQVNTHSHVYALFAGKRCIDKIKKQAYTMLTRVHLKASNNPSAPPYEVLSEWYKSHKQNHHDTIVGWLYVTPQLTIQPYHFYDMHKNLFNNAQDIGMLWQTNRVNTITLQNMQLIANNFEQNEPFTYFKYLFLYEKLY